ncbi:hypothetical protein GCM10023068_36560 [Leifsonia shinshuensis]
MFAVSQNVIPASTAWRKIGAAASSSSAHSLKPRDLSPKLMQPSARRLTVRPVDPSRVYSIVSFPFPLRRSVASTVASLRRSVALTVPVGAPHEGGTADTAIGPTIAA